MLHNVYFSYFVLSFFWTNLYLSWVTSTKKVNSTNDCLQPLFSIWNINDWLQPQFFTLPEYLQIIHVFFFLEYLLSSCCILPYELTLPLLIILEDQTIYLIIAEFSYILISLWYYLQINLKILWLWPMSIKVLRQVVLLNILTGWLAKYLRAIQLLTYLFPQLVIFIKRHHYKSMELLYIQNIVVQPVVIFA